MSENKQTGVEFYPIDEMRKCAPIASFVAGSDTTYDVLAPVAASLEVGRHIYITLLRTAIEQGRIKLSDLPEAGILGALHVLGALIEENYRLRSMNHNVGAVIHELSRNAAEIEEAREYIDDTVQAIDERIDKIRTTMDELNSATCGVDGGIVELKELFNVGDGA